MAGIKDIGQSNQWRAGLTLKLSSFSFTYAVGTHADLGITHKIGIEINE